MTGETKGGEKSPPATYFSDEWLERERKIIAAFNKLPGVSEIEFTPGFSPIARNIMLMAPRPLNAGTAEFRRRFEPADEATTGKEIAAVKIAAAKLAAALSSLHEPAIMALNLDQLHFSQIETRIRLLKLQAEQAHVPNSPKNATRRKPKRHDLKLFSKSIAEHYYFVTGKPPTRRINPENGTAYGPFIALLTEIFDIYGIKANADAEAREAIKSMEITWLKMAE
jgi:hypothetical protein